MLIHESQAHSYLTSPIVKVVVNEYEASRIFYMRHGLIVPRPCFVRNALKKYGETGCIVWLESEEGIVRLPEADPEVFARYIQLLYQRQLSVCNVTPCFDAKGNQIPSPAVLGRVDQLYELLAKLYILCEMLQRLR